MHYMQQDSKEKNKGRPTLCWIDNINEHLASPGLKLRVLSMDLTKEEDNGGHSFVPINPQTAGVRN